MAWYRHRAAFEIVAHDSMSSCVMNVEVTKIWATSEIFWTPNKQNQINPEIQCIIQGVSGNAHLWCIMKRHWSAVDSVCLHATQCQWTLPETPQHRFVHFYRNGLWKKICITFLLSFFRIKSEVSTSLDCTVKMFKLLICLL